ncbi:MAG: elongation factor P [Candidatus Levybacteria bacterium]|nr:elongation factor P [Candidatus Levybacteria bacterium]
MISVNELRSGTFYTDQGQIFQVLSFEHIKMGRGSANIKVKVQNVRTGSITDKSFINNAKVEDINIRKRPMQFLYKDSEIANFMDPQTFEQVEIPLKVLIGYEFLKEGETFTVSFYADEPLALLLPPKMELKVADTGPSLRGNSATNIYKDAILENGVKTKVPLFIEAGDKIKVDTRTGTYTEKV